MERTEVHIIDKLFHTFLMEKKDKEIHVTSKGRQLLELVPEDLKKRWQKLILEIYNQYCPRETARQLLAWSESKPFAKEKSSKKG